MQNSVSLWALSPLVCALLFALAPAPTLAQSDGGSAKKQKIEELKSAYASGIKAAKANQSDQAYTDLEHSLGLAKEVGVSNVVSKIQGYLQKLPKNWGNKAIENKKYDDALTHFEKGVKHAPDDAYMHYGKGLALVNLDSTRAGLESMQKAIEVGNRTGNTRVVGLAEQRIRDEFLARASKALNAQNPTDAQADSALSALDDMKTYVDSSSQSLFYRGRAQYEKGAYTQAISSAEQGLDMHQGSRSDAAKYYFIIAESQMKLGDKSTACQTFQQATYGDYKARAEHYLKNECDN